MNWKAGIPAFRYVSSSAWSIHMKRFTAFLALLVFALMQTASAQNVYGEMKLEYTDGFLLAKTAMPNGEQGWFAVDLATGTTAVTKAYAGTSQIDDMRGDRDPLAPPAAHFALGGFGVSSEIVGKTTLPQLTVGGLQFENANVMVIDRMPEIGGHRIAGILGVDMLRRAEIAVFMYGDTPRLLLKSRERPAAEGALVVPMRIENDYVLIDGKLNNQPVHFLIDTGSPESYIPVKTVRATGAAAMPNSTRTITLLDGSEATVRDAKVKSLDIAGRSFSAADFRIGELPVFDMLPGDVTPVLLGNSFLGAMQSVQFNFTEKTVRLIVQ